MDIKSLGSTPSRKTPAEYFTGTVWQDPIIEAPEPARPAAAWVRFEPGARTAWHTHPLGQTIHITAGVGRVQAWGGPIKGGAPRRHGVLRAEREALAWRRAQHGDDASCHAGGARSRRHRRAGRARLRRAVGMQHHGAGVAHGVGIGLASTSTSWPADISRSIRWPSKRDSIRRLVCVEPQVRPSSQRGASSARSSGWPNSTWRVNSAACVCGWPSPPMVP